MSLHKLVLGAAIAAPLALAGCGEESGSFQLKLVHLDCADQEQLPAASTLHITVTGPGMTAKTETVAATSRSAELPNIPLGKDRVVTVEAFGGNELLASGRSMPFDLSDSGTPKVQVIIRGVNRFSAACDEANDKAEMIQPRAGHTAVLMDDGRVLLAGGFKQLLRSGIGVDYQSSAEIYDAETGTFAPAGDVGFPVAHAPGVLLKDGRVLIVGGEALDGANATSVASAAIFNPKTNAWSQVQMNVARRGHTATLLSDGKVLVIGGLDETNKVLDSLELFDPATGAFTLVDGVTLPTPVGGGRAFHNAIARDGGRIDVAGGIGADGSTQSKVFYVNYDKNSGKLSVLTGASGREINLIAPVLRAGAGLVNGMYTLVGGATSWSAATGRYEGASRTAQWYDLPQGTPTDANVLQQSYFERVQPCVVSLDKNRTLVAGGFLAGGAPSESAEILAWDSSRKVVVPSFVAGQSEQFSKMILPRGYLTCTNLGDDRVLITGGAFDFEGNATRSAEIYVLKPL